MNLQSQLAALSREGHDHTLRESAELSCRLAKQLEKTGEYEGAYEALNQFWPERNKPPKLEGLDAATKAEILLRVGALAGWLGSTDQTDGSQETAKDLITKSIEIFEGLGQSARVAEGHADLALCYFREGSFDEARIHLDTALRNAKDEEGDLRAVVLIRAGEVEVAAGQLNEALRYYNDAIPLLDRSEDHALKGAFHSEFARLFRRFGRAESIDRALIEYAAASFHFEQAGNVRYLARVENNLGYLFFTIGRFNEAHRHLDRARHLFLELKDVGTTARVDETRARVLLAEGRVTEAERVVRYAVRTLEKGDEQAVLTEALTTHGTALARLGNHLAARNLLQRAIDIAETAGDLEGAGRAKLGIIEELAGQTSATEQASIYLSAAQLLRHSQDPSTGERLIACAGRVIHALGVTQPAGEAHKEDPWEGFSFKREIKRVEKELIERALRDAGGSVTKASRKLGFKHHQSLISLIETRHRELLKTRSVVRRRRRHLFSPPKRTRSKSPPPAERVTSQISILHVEADRVVAQAVNDLLTTGQWQVEPCADGNSALRKLTDEKRYDLILVDDQLPGINGIELVRRARRITHRRRTPIVILSGDDYETESWRAGADAFLKRPEQINELPATIARLLKERARRP